MVKKKDKPLMQIGNLWKKERKDGSAFLSGPFGENSTIYIFSNRNKKHDKHPDFNILVGEN